jgi:hypothetical protein
MSGCLPAGATLPAGYRAIKKPFNAKELIGLLSEELRRSPKLTPPYSPKLTQPF